MSEIKTNSYLGPICPYCGYEHEALDRAEEFAQGGLHEEVCDNCGAEFLFSATLEHSYSFNSEPKEYAGDDLCAS